MSDRSTNWCWHGLCLIHRYRQDKQGFHRALDACEQANGDPRDRMHRAIMAGYRAWWGTPEQTSQALELAESLTMSGNNPALRVWWHWTHGLAAATAGRADEAIDAYHRCHDLAAAIGHHIMESTSAQFIGLALLDAGRIRVDEERLILSAADQNQIQVERSLARMARRLTTSNHHQQAAVLLGYVSRHYDDSGDLGSDCTP
jgi:hypothetical protein